WAADDRRERLRQHWDVDGWTAQHIADDLGCTKNAVIGAVHRDRLTERREHHAPPTPVVASFLSLDPGQCCWPQRRDDERPLDEAEPPGHRDFAFCGARRAPESPYCEAHRVRSLQKPGKPWTP